MNRRLFLKGLTAAAAGLMVPDRTIWALDQTMLRPGIPHSGDGNFWQEYLIVLPAPPWQPRILPVAHPDYFEPGQDISLGSERFRILGKMKMRIDE